MAGLAGLVQVRTPFGEFVGVAVVDRIQDFYGRSLQATGKANPGLPVRRQAGGVCIFLILQLRLQLSFE